MELENKTKEVVEYVQSLFDKEIYACGGCVRDLIMGNTPKDYDFCSSLTTEEVKEQLKGKHKVYCVGEKHGTIGFFFKIGDEKIDVEITTFRKKEVYKNSRKPEVEFGTDLLEDLKRRDFTCNSLALNCTSGELIDPFNGIEDIENRIIRTPMSPKESFKSDPLRILRCIRFASRFGFEIEEQTLKALKKQTFTLLKISKERWVSELDKILLDENVFNGLKMLWEYDIFKFILPELHLQWKYDQNSLYHNYELWEHTAHVVKGARDAGEDIDVLWSALCHDVGKPMSREDKRRIIFDNDFAKRVFNYLKENNREMYIKFTNGYDEIYTSHYLFHELIGAEMADRICTYLKFSNKRKETVVNLVRTHLNKDCPIKKYDDSAKSEVSKQLEKVFLK